MHATVFEEATQTIADAADEFLRLARRLSLGEQPDSDRIAGICADARKSPAELSDFVSQLKARAAMRERIAAADAVEARRAAVQASIDRAESELAEALRKRDREVTALRAEQNTLVSEWAQASLLPSQLARTCPDQSLVRKNEEMRRRGREVTQSVHNAVQAVRGAESALAEAEPSAKSEMLARLNRAKAHLESVRREQAEVVRESEIAFQACVDF